jgi:hypothetical protein
MLASRLLALYEASVQEAPAEARRLASFYRQCYGQEARALVEDFCGSFWLGYEWVRLHPKNHSWGIDLDAEVIQAGRDRHALRLSADQRERAQPRLGNVLTSKHPKADLIHAGNFSFFTFRERKLLLRYFKRCRARLKERGLLVLDHFGGPDCLKPSIEKRRVLGDDGEVFTYTWEQHGYSHVTGFADFSIHFRTRQEGSVCHAFKYVWRIWTLPELRDLLTEAGFKQVDVFWEFDNGFRKTLYGEDGCLATLSYIVASK